MNNFFAYNASNRTWYKLELTSDISIISASGGSANLYTTIIKYINQKEISRVAVNGTVGIVGIPDDGLTLSSNNTVSASSRYTTVDDNNRHITLCASYTIDGKEINSNNLIIYQEANTATYGDVVITLSADTYDLPASGGSFSSIGWTGSQRVTYTSGSYIDYDKSNITVRDKTPAVTVFSAGTTIKSRTYIDRKEWYFDGQGGKSTVAGVDVYQEANEIISSVFTKNIAAPFTIVRAGGSFYLSGRQTNTYTSSATEIVACAPKYNTLPSWITITSESDPNNILFSCSSHNDLTWDKRIWDTGSSCTITQNGYYLMYVKEEVIESNPCYVNNKYYLYSADNDSYRSFSSDKLVSFILYISNIDENDSNTVERVKFQLSWNGDPYIITYDASSKYNCMARSPHTQVFVDTSKMNYLIYDDYMINVSTSPIRLISNLALRLNESGNLRLIN